MAVKSKRASWVRSSAARVLQHLLLARSAAVITTVCCALFGVSTLAHAQNPVPTDGFGFQRHQEYVQWESYEWFNPQTLSVMIKFTDLILPGNNGHELRFVRTYDGGALNLWGQPQGWIIGAEGIPMWILNGCYSCNPNHPFNSENPDAYVTTTPVVITGDGAVKRTFYMDTPQTGNAASQRWVDTVDNWKYDKLERKLYLNDGTICDYETNGTLGDYRLTTCSDPYGVFLSVAYSGPFGSTTTFTQHLYDGRPDRQVTISGGQLTYDGRTWTFNGTSAVMPDGSVWGFAYESGYLKKIVTPWGGETHYTYVSPSSLELVWYETCGCWDYLEVFRGPFLSTRRTVDNGVTTGTWTLGNFFFPPGANDNRPETYTLTRPSGPSMTFALCLNHWTNTLTQYGRLAGGDHGVCGISLGPSRSMGFRYHLEYFRGYPGSYANLMRFVLDTKDIIDCDAPNACTTHRTTYTYDPLFNVASETETNLDYPGATRVTTRTYLNSHNASESRNFAGLLTSHSVTSGGETVVRSWTRNSETGFVDSATVGGITTTFQPDARGNIATASIATGDGITYSHERGVLKDTVTPAYTVSRVVRDDGLVLSETKGGRTTTYGYDPVGRRTSIQYPDNVAPVVTTYSPLARTTTVTRGPSIVVTTLDGFGRVIGAINGVGAQTRIAYDAEGRKTYESLPFGNGVTEVGAEFFYDDVNRVTRESHADGTYLARTYGRSLQTVRDEKNRTTVIKFQTFGDPGGGRVAQVVDPAGQTWNYSYDVLDNLTRVDGPDGVVRTWTYDPTSHLLIAESHPESGTVTYTNYESDGLLQRKVDANGTAFVYAYDHNRRVREITATPVSGPSQVTTFTYELGSDLRATATVDDATTVWTYDSAGRLATRTDTVDGRAFTVTYAYDAMDNIKRITYPSGRLIAYEYDTENRIARVFNAFTDATYADQFTYHPSGAVATYRAGNGLVTTLTYHQARQWLDTIAVGPNGSVLDLDYSYDEIGNISEILDARAGMSQTFGYDALDRLTTAQGSYGALTYTYDAHGNRQTENGVQLTYHNGYPFHLKSIGGFYDLVYSNNGNLRWGFGGIYNYTPDNLMESAAINGVVSRFAYDADAWRLKKSVDGGATSYYVRGPSGQLLMEYESGPVIKLRDYIYSGGRLIAMIPTTLSGGGLPSGWSGTDVGTVALAGSSSESNGTFTVSGAGADIWGTADGFQYVATQLTGNGSIIARVATLQGTHAWAKAGVMMRDSLSTDAAHAFSLVSLSNGVAFQRRTTRGGITTHTSGGSGAAPRWVRLTREGSSVAAYTSSDGSTWTLIDTDTVSLGSTIYVGLAVTSHDATATAMATFDSVSVTEGAWTGMPSGWGTEDIGAVGVSGGASYDNGTFSVTGSGTDIWDAADQFRYVYRILQGDGTITAHVSSVEYVHRWTKAGVMIRESLSAGAPHAYMLVSADRGLAFQRRVAASEISTHTDAGPGTAPYWVRLVRAGATISAYSSTDGSSWSFVGSEAISMGNTVYVGLAVVSHNNGISATATFDNVEVQ
jgi:YD repeat-containing protein